MFKLSQIIVLVLVSCIMVALGGWVLYIDQNEQITGFKSQQQSPQQSQPGLFVSTIALFGFVSLLAISGKLEIKT